MSSRSVSLKLDYLPQMPKDKSVPIGCIGAGFIMADCHLVSYRQAGFNPVAICSRSRERADEVADQHQIPKVYDSYQELLDDPEIKVVDVAVPPDLQLSVIREIVQHKKRIRGVLAHKPLGVDYAEAREIVRLCKRAGIALARVSRNTRVRQY
jgi:hypothetical protein